jgi:hypothetical protein
MKPLKRFIIALCLVAPLISAAQEVPYTNPYTTQPLNNQSPPTDFPSFRERIYFGGNVGAWIGSTTYVNVSPLIGFHVTKKLSFGGGGTYNYYNENYGGYKYTSTVYGSNFFGRYMITDNFFAQAQWDRLSVIDYTSPILNERAWVHNLLVGGGYKQLFTQKASFVAMIFYNVNQTPLSPYTNPIVQIGFNINL